MTKGWVNEFERHSLARQGIKTGRKSQKGYFKGLSVRTADKLAWENRKASMEVEEKEKQDLLLKEKKDVVHHFDEFTTSDLQGTVEALAKEYGVDDDELLQEIIIAHNYKTKKLQDEYLDSKEFDKYRIVRRKEKEVFNHG